MIFAKIFRRPVTVQEQIQQCVTKAQWLLYGTHFGPEPKWRTGLIEKRKTIGQWLFLAAGIGFAFLVFYFIATLW